jgi:anti-sigma regulatory factor (Ser/Thr protein kinase)
MPGKNTPQLCGWPGAPASGGPAIAAPCAPAARRFEDAYDASPSQVRAARHAVARFLAGCELADEAVLVISELAANSVLHSRSKDGGEFTVRVEVHGEEYIFMEVEDAGGPWRAQPPDPERPHGLQLVDALCGHGHWGVEDIGAGGVGGRVVWARLFR